jgi:hypothetical protein
MRVTGKIRSEEAIQLIVSRSNTLDGLPDEKKKQWKTLCDDLNDAEQQFAKKRVEVKFQGCCDTYNKNKAPNKLQRQAGEADLMPIVEDRIPYGLLLKDRDMEQILLELAYRGLSTDGGGWRDHLLKQLKEHKGNKKDFLPQSPDADFSFVWEEDQLIKR